MVFPRTGNLPGSGGEPSFPAQNLRAATLNQLGLTECYYMQEILPAVEPNLHSPAQPLRAATLNLLATLRPEGDQIFTPLAAVEGGSYHEDGRKAEMALQRTGEAVEYKRVPETLIKPIVLALLGGTYIKCVLYLWGLGYLRCSLCRTIFAVFWFWEHDDGRKAESFTANWGGRGEP